MKFKLAPPLKSVAALSCEKYKYKHTALQHS